MNWIKGEYFVPIWGDVKIHQHYKQGKLSFQEAVYATALTAAASGLHAGYMLAHHNKGSLMTVRAAQAMVTAAPGVAIAAPIVMGAAAAAITYEKKVMKKVRGKSGLNVTPFGGQGFGSVV